MARYFFVYALARRQPLHPVAHLVSSDSFEGACKARTVVIADAPQEALLYCSNVKEGTHAERVMRGEVPLQRPPRVGTDALHTATRPNYPPDVAPEDGVDEPKQCAGPYGCSNLARDGSNYCGDCEQEPKVVC